MLENTVAMQITDPVPEGQCLETWIYCLKWSSKTSIY